MVASILQLPTELLLPILGFLPITSLLKFSQCSRYARSIANSSLHTLELEFRSPDHQREAYVPTRGVFSTKPGGNSSQFLKKLATSFDYRKAILENKKECLSSNKKSPYKITVHIPDAHMYDYTILFNFHAALASSILTRYHNALQNLDISLWTLTAPVAKAISHLSVLRSLSIKLEDDTCLRNIPDVQNKAWQILAGPNVWDGRLYSLKIENADITPSQLTRILGNNPHCQELRLANCNSVGRALWELLGGQWKGQTRLRLLSIAKCGGVVSEETLKAIEKLNGLQHLDLYGCAGLSTATVSEWNRSVGHIPKVIPPRSPSMSGQEELEIDPDYMSDSEE